MRKDEEMLWKLVDRSITDEEFDQLQDTLSMSSELRRTYQDVMEMDGALRAVEMQKEEPSAGMKRGRRKIWFGAIGAAAASLAMLVLWPAGEREEVEVVDQTSQGFRFVAWGSAISPRTTSALAEEIRERALLMASISGIGGSEKQGNVILPYPLPGGVLEVTEGWVELTFEGSAIVKLEAPATFEVISPSSGYLYQGNVVVTDDGDGKPFDLYHSQGKVVDIGTAYAMRVKEEDSYDIFVLEGTVDNYNGAILALDRLKEGDHLVGDQSGKLSIERIEGAPSWVTEWSLRKVISEQKVGSGPRKIQTAAWLRGRYGSGVSYGSLSGVGLNVSSDACHNSGDIYQMRWTDYLGEYQPAESWYHREAATIGAEADLRQNDTPTSVKVEFNDRVENPVLLFGWGESSMQVDLRDLKVQEDSFACVHSSITFQNGVIDFGNHPLRQDLEGQIATVQVMGEFGPNKPLVFDLVNLDASDETLAFSLGLIDER